MESLLTPEFWLAVGQIVMIDVLLGGDNAVVIALACRNLSPELRRRGILWGTAGAIVLHIEGASKLATLERARAGGPEADMPIRAVLARSDVDVFRCP